MVSPYAFRKGPSYGAANRGEQFEAAFEQPLNAQSTFAQGVVGGALESFGLGTVIRDFSIPQGRDVPADPEQATGPRIGPDAAAGAIYGGIRDFFNPPSEDPAMTSDEWKASPYFRANIPFDPSMTEDRAAALAVWNDARAVREHFADKSPIVSFFGNLAGQAVDPINYIPIAGPTVKAAAVSKFGTILGSVATGALDAAANTAAAGALTAGARAQYGDDVSWQRQISEVATAALIGAAFGGVGGFIEGRRSVAALARANTEAATLRTTQEARLALNGGIRGLALEDGVTLLPNEVEPITRQADAANKSADAMAAMLDPAAEVVASATARLQAVGYDLRQLPAAEVTPIMQQAPIEDAAKALDVQNLRQLDTRLAELEAETPGVNTYAPGLRLREDIAPNAQVYGGRTEPARSLEEYRAEVATARQARDELAARIERGEPDPASVENISTARRWSAERRQQGAGAPILGTQAAPPAVDASPPRQPEAPDGREPASAAVGKPDDAKALAAQYGVDPKTGDFAEQTDIDQLMGQGRISEADEAELAAADENLDRANSYGQALMTAARCMVAL